MTLFGLRARRPKPDDPARERIAAWAREAGGLPPETVLKVNEIVCPDPACPGIETVILIMPQGAPTRARKVGKPMTEVSRADIIGAFAADTGKP